MTRCRSGRRASAPLPPWFIPPPALAARKRPGDLRLLSWNVHKGIGGLDGLYLPWRITEVIRFERPDIVLLQEVAERIPRLRRDRQAESWALALGYPHRIFQPTVRLEGGCWGNAILSRFAIARSHTVELSFPLKKRRTALVAEMVVRARGGERRLHVVNIHLGLSGVERRWQMRRLLASEPLRGLSRTSRVVIGGDTNDWSGALARRRGALRKAGYLAAWGRARGAIASFPAWYPVAALDRVFLRGAISCRHAHRSHHALARLASDHLPVVMDLAVRRT